MTDLTDKFLRLTRKMDSLGTRFNHFVACFPLQVGKKQTDFTDKTIAEKRQIALDTYQDFVITESNCKPPPRHNGLSPHQHIKIATNLLHDVVADNPVDFEAYEALSYLLCKQGKNVETFDMWYNLREKHPDNVGVLIELNVMHLSFGEPHKARNILDEARRLPCGEKEKFRIDSLLEGLVRGIQEDGQHRIDL